MVQGWNGEKMLNWHNSIDGAVQGAVTWACQEERDRYVDLTLRVKYRGWLIVRLKAIKSKENLLSYLSSYTSPIFLAHYLVPLVEYRLVIDLSGRLSCPNNFQCSNNSIKSLSHWVVWGSCKELLGRRSMRKLCPSKSAPTDKSRCWIPSLRQLSIVPYIISR